jgi:hypothetical protein
MLLRLSFLRARRRVHHMQLHVPFALRQLVHGPVRCARVASNVFASYLPEIWRDVGGQPESAYEAVLPLVYGSLGAPMAVGSPSKRRPKVRQEGVRIFGWLWRKH